MTLRETIISAPGIDASPDENQCPSNVPAYIVSREQFRDAARMMKTADARLVAEWATDESHYSSLPLPSGEREGVRGGALAFMPAMQGTMNI